eukprot:12190234-Prorocentrum_lima.AAC.1
MKHKQLPALELPPGRHTKPALTRRICEQCIAEITVKIGTWGTNAQGQWVSMVKKQEGNMK